MPRSPTHSRGRRKDIEQLQCTYLVEIIDWDWSFSFGIANLKYHALPYYDFRHLLLKARLLLPSSIASEHVELVFLPSSDLNQSEWGDEPASAVGSLRTEKNMLQGLISMPSDALGPLLQGLIASRIRYVTMNGSRFRYRKALIFSYCLHSEIDKDNYIWEE
jgi:hypothetical protein